MHSDGHAKASKGSNHMETWKCHTVWIISYDKLKVKTSQTHELCHFTCVQRSLDRTFRTECRTFGDVRFEFFKRITWFSAKWTPRNRVRFRYCRQGEYRSTKSQFVEKVQWDKRRKNWRNPKRSKIIKF